MLDITTHNYFIFTRKEFWFYDGEEIKEGTYNVYTASKKAPIWENKFQEKYKTSVINLLKSEEDLFKSIHSTYRYDIRSAKKKQVFYKTILNPQKEDCIDLLQAYNAFAKHKKLPVMSLQRILAFQKTGNLCITKTMLEGIEISTHIYLFDENTISLTNSFHNIHFTNDKIRSEANKYLHWRDILQFKLMNFKQYDFGGLNEKKHPGIGKFKLNFGGEITENYRFIKTSPLIFYIIAILKKINGIK
jgi:lipid II:glycine glycyltransferase (peptidoglycan interpeptide bridge formation enzyme)